MVKTYLMNPESITTEAFLRSESGEKPPMLRLVCQYDWPVLGFFGTEEEYRERLIRALTKPKKTTYT